MIDALNAARGSWCLRCRADDLQIFEIKRPWCQDCQRVRHLGTHLLLAFSDAWLPNRTARELSFSSLQAVISYAFSSRRLRPSGASTKQRRQGHFETTAKDLLCFRRTVGALVSRVPMCPGVTRFLSLVARMHGGRLRRWRVVGLFDGCRVCCSFSFFLLFAIVALYTFAHRPSHHLDERTPQKSNAPSPDAMIAVA